MELDVERLSRILAAISFAARRHEGQRRKDGATPYVAHAARVLFIAREVGGVRDADALAAAALHDTIEDTPADRESISARFGEEVARHVAALSKDPRLPEEERERRYLAGLVEAPLADTLCKLADTLDNLFDVEGLDEAARRKALARARLVADAFASHVPPERSQLLEAVRARLQALEA